MSYVLLKLFGQRLKLVVEVIEHAVSFCFAFFWSNLGFFKSYRRQVLKLAGLNENEIELELKRDPCNCSGCSITCDKDFTTLGEHAVSFSFPSNSFLKIIFLKAKTTIFAKRMRPSLKRLSKLYHNGLHINFLDESTYKFRVEGHL